MYKYKKATQFRINKSTKQYFKDAYRLVRQPDLYMACDVDGTYRFKSDIPLGLIKLAEACLENRLRHV